MPFDFKLSRPLTTLKLGTDGVGIKHLTFGELSLLFQCILRAILGAHCD